jgi:hypothetical protein
MTLSAAQMEEIGKLRKRLAETHDLRLLVDKGTTGWAGRMYGIGEAGSAAADAYNFLATLQASPSRTPIYA